jgi:lipopolysaccharide export system protein LptA
MTNGVEVVQGQEAVYTVATGVVVLTGDVLVTQGASTIAGPKLTYNLESGSGVMDGGRVQSVFVPGSGAGSDAKE